MLNLRNLMDFLPYYYKEADTYKVSGKGILERYLEIFGNYFEDYIVADTKNILDIIDIDHCPEMYLNYLWEFLGQMPFAYGCNIDSEKWFLYFNGFDSEEKISELSQLWIIPKDSNDKFNLSTDQVRKLLKYSISLFKIRGTKKFFEILFRIYGIDCEISMPPTERFSSDSNNYYGTDDDFAGSDSIGLHDYEGREMYISRYQNTKFDIEDNCLDECPLDRRSTCTKCIVLPITLTNHGFNPVDAVGVTTVESMIYSSEFSSLIMDSEDHILYGLRWNDTEYTPDLTGGTITIDGTEYEASYILNHLLNGNLPNNNFIQFQKICEAIMDRFLPYNVQADINYGFTIPCTYHISTYLKEGDQWLFLKSDTSFEPSNLQKLYLQDNLRRELQVKVLISRTYRNTDDLKFRVGSITQVSPGETPIIKTMGEAEHVSTDVIHITRSLDGAEYLFISSEPNSDGTYTKLGLQVTRKTTLKEYFLEAHTVEGTNTLSVDHLFLNLVLTGYLTMDGESYSSKIMDLDTGTVYSSSANLVISKPKVYRFGLVDFPIKQITVPINRVPEKLGIRVSPETSIITTPNQIVRSHVVIEGDYDAPDTDRHIVTIQARTSGGTILNDLVLEMDYIVDNPNVVQSTICGYGAIPLLDEDHATVSIEPIEAIRICHIKNLIRNTSQTLTVHTKKLEGGIWVSQYVNLLSQATYHKGRLSSGSVTIVADPDFVYSDWIPVSEYQGGFTDESTPKPINCIEYHLLCSKFKYYEIANRSVEYNNGEYFETSYPGTFIFKPVLEGDLEINPNYSQASYLVTSTVNQDVKYGLLVNPKELTYQNVIGQSYTKAVNTVITVSTNLEYSEGFRRDTLYPLNFRVYIYSRSDWEDSTPGHTPTPLKVIDPSDEGWNINSQSSKYEKYISVRFTDGSGDTSDFPAQGNTSDGKYILILDSSNTLGGYSRSQSILLLDYIDPNKDHLILVPYIAEDNGWNGKDWEDDNKSATWYFNMAQYSTNYISVHIQGTDGSLNDYNLVRVYKLNNGVETLVQTFNVDTRPTSINNNTPGIYHLRVNNGVEDSLDYVTIEISSTSLEYNISCTPLSVPQGIFSSIGVRVFASANMQVPESQLYVKRMDENNWYPPGHQFTINSPNNGQDTTFTFQVKGDSSKTCTFTFLAPPNS